MSSTTINRLTNANVYLNGKSLLGKVEECENPDVKGMFAEHKALGLMGKVEFWSGIDKMEAKFKWNSFYSDVMKAAANPVSTQSIQVRGSLETYTSAGRTAQVPVVIHMTGQFKDLPAGKFKQHDNVDITSGMSVQYLKIEINGELICEVDALANIYNVGGTDVLATYRQNLGI